MLNIRAALVGCGAHAQMTIVPCIKLSPVTLIATCDIILGMAPEPGVEVRVCAVELAESILMSEG